MFDEELKKLVAMGFEKVILLVHRGVSSFWPFKRVFFHVEIQIQTIEGTILINDSAVHKYKSYD